MNESALLRLYRRKVLAKPDALPFQFEYTRFDIERLIPHRDPFLFLDSLFALDLENATLAGRKHLIPDLPLFKGHFPDYPVFPGSLQVETIGQLGLCLHHFVGENTHLINEDAKLPDVRATRVCGAFFRMELRPGDDMVILAKLIEHDEYLGKILGQVTLRGEVATTALLEVAFL
ncbi:3-hydroxyacyl-[acyl-carrier-protein] dehydratase, FabZ form [Olavius algarvensis spirochete endosymbiont]|uniref:3-hydroxyacyl-ACP dehydratase FabZ family protein n=1 Tax=Olavius algarvensis spirochete endosymbiont TaxID=260710 RepID=UPI000F1AE02B|nr:3-hydroxyacyl-ACP dehydratase FabZ family protein [Olavius algarvensis spirochete endosymbiont]VDB00634.1 3-hydroxyacyl-[acyl-carrier-protein] dehydratase, FabZ form [Olavius algarvensis spirochete endosymbiont]